MAVWIRTDGIIESVVPQHGEKFDVNDIRKRVGGTFESVVLNTNEVLFKAKTSEKGRKRDPNTEATKMAAQRGATCEILGHALVLKPIEVSAEAALPQTDPPKPKKPPKVAKAVKVIKPPKVAKVVKPPKAPKAKHLGRARAIAAKTVAKAKTKRAGSKK